MTQTIHLLPEHIANQIAAGEVVERPASVVKELVENSVDAGATSITVRLTHAGKSKIEVEDNGIGMSEDDAQMSVQRHATSKIDSLDDLHRIASHGFRGEALPSIASVSRFRMQTCEKNADAGVEIQVNGGVGCEVKPIASRLGTRIEILDLFLNTPARLHFMRTDKTEEAAVIEVFKALALAHHHVSFSLECDGKKRLDITSSSSERERVNTLMGKDFSENSIVQETEYEGVMIKAYMGLATFHHRNASRMIFVLNGRVIRDKQLIAAARTGYRDVMFHDRYPVAVLSISIDPKDVDINVHPAKREVRFQSPKKIYSAIVACLREGIERVGMQVSSVPTEQALQRMQPSSQQNKTNYSASSNHYVGGSSSPARHQGLYSDDIQKRLFSGSSMAAESANASYDVDQQLCLGTPLAQIHQCYILSQTADGIILIDQHAAHERMTYEAMKQQQKLGSLVCQSLLVPYEWHVDSEMAEWVHDNYTNLDIFAIELEHKKEDCFFLKGMPALLKDESPEALLNELVESCMLIGVEAEGRSRVLERWMGNRACKGSIKAGRSLSLEEQNTLLREMESTDNIAQCNHGRPTYVRLSLNELDRLFGRKD